MDARTLRRLACSTLIAFAVPAATAAADGGKDIASATPAAWGQQQFGNTATGGVDEEGEYRSWWQLGVSAGDQVTIDWEAANDETRLIVFPTGTTDFTFTQEEPVASDYPASNLKSQLQFKAARSGAMPMEFKIDYEAGTGPYSFTAYVKHAVRLSVPRARSMPLAGTVGVGVSNPDGAPISDAGLAVALQARKAGARRFVTIGTGSAAGGTAAIGYTAPAGFRYRKKRRNPVTLRAVATGADYLTHTSSTQKVKLR